MSFLHFFEFSFSRWKNKYITLFSNWVTRSSHYMHISVVKDRVLHVIHSSSSAGEGWVWAGTGSTQEKLKEMALGVKGWKGGVICGKCIAMSHNRWAAGWAVLGRLCGGSIVMREHGEKHLWSNMTQLLWIQLLDILVACKFPVWIPYQSFDSQIVQQCGRVYSKSIYYTIVCYVDRLKVWKSFSSCF